MSEICRAKNTSIKLPIYIKLAFHFISFLPKLGEFSLHSLTPLVYDTIFAILSYTYWALLYRVFPTKPLCTLLVSLTHVLCPTLILLYFNHSNVFAVVIVSIHRHFLIGTSLLATTATPNTVPSSFSLQYRTYYVWRSKYSCHL